MFWGISFCVGNKTIEVNGQEFSLGELSAECLNITVDDYAGLHKVSKQVVKMLNTYETSHDFDDWFQANEALMQLDGMLRKYHLFRLLRDDTSILSEAREFSQQYALFDNVDCVFSEHDLSIMAQIGEYEDYLNNPTAYGGEDQPPVPPIPPEKTRACLIYPGDIGTKWKVYRDFADRYVMIISDIASFNTTIQNFVRIVLSKLEKMNANQYVAALYDFFNYERADKLIANPVRGSGYYFGVDTVELRHIPRET